MLQLFPDIDPYVSHSISVDSPHMLHVEECGNPDGLPVLFVHGGPGAGCEPYHRRFFDPEIYRIILFDQRGCGRSTPHAELEGNTTQTLVADMEVIRAHLGIDRWLIFGGSWGSTLSLVYAQTWPERVMALILRGIFLCRPDEIRWFYQQGASQLLPDNWQDFIAPIPMEERDDLVSAYAKRLNSDDEITRMAAAKAWSVWEGCASTLLPTPAVKDHFSNPFTALSLARVENHFFSHNSFLEPNQILRDIDRIRDIPGVIVHGRYDVVCPLKSAWELHLAWPAAEYHVIANAGHSAAEPGITDVLIRATSRLGRELG